MNAPFSLVSVKITIVPGPQLSGSRRDRFGKPAQVGPQVSHAHQLLELIDAAETLPLEVLVLEPQRFVGLVELPRALARVPFRLERRQQAASLRVIGALDVRVWAGAFGEGPLAT